MGLEGDAAYRIYYNIPAAGLAFQPKKKVGIIRDAGILKRLDYFFIALKSSLRIPLQQKGLLNKNETSFTRCEIWTFDELAT